MLEQEQQQGGGQVYSGPARVGLARSRHSLGTDNESYINKHKSSAQSFASAAAGGGAAAAGLEQQAGWAMALLEPAFSSSNFFVVFLVFEAICWSFVSSGVAVVLDRQVMLQPAAQQVHATFNGWPAVGVGWPQEYATCNILVKYPCYCFEVLDIGINVHIVRAAANFRVLKPVVQ